MAAAKRGLLHHPSQAPGSAASELQRSAEQQQPAGGEAFRPNDPVAAAQAAAEYSGLKLHSKQRHTSSKKKLLSEEKLRRLKDQHNKRGIIYISRLPPHMKPGKLRQLLSAYGEIGRIYCTPEDQGARKQRKKKGGNSGKNFIEGWVEFEDKAIAKQVAAALNGQQVGGKHRSAHHFDLWCMKYLPKFKWDHLTEEIAYERAVREQRLAHELTAAKRERDFYLSRVDKAKALAAMEQRRQAKHQQHQGGDAATDAEQKPAAVQQQQGQTSNGGSPSAAIADGAADGHAAAQAGSKTNQSGVKRTYGQRKVKQDPAEPGAGEIGVDVLGMLLAEKKQKMDS